VWRQRVFKGSLEVWEHIGAHMLRLPSFRKIQNTWTSPTTKYYIKEENIIFSSINEVDKAFFIGEIWAIGDFLFFIQNNNGFGGFISTYFEQKFIKWLDFYIKFQWETNYIEIYIYIIFKKLVNTLVLLVANSTLGLEIIDFWKKFLIL